MNQLQLFMRIYMYELELCLKSHIDELADISFQSDEANTDRPLKEYMKNIIENECNCIKNFSDVSKIHIMDSSLCIKNYDITTEIKSIFVQQVLLPEKITPQIKRLLQTGKHTVFTKPDICLKINTNGKIMYESVELKSTKSDSIPGSSIQQISPEEWVVFIKHNQKQVEVTTGQYVYAINSKMQFPDRSPRPQVSFSELQKWNSKYRIDEKTDLYFYSNGEESEKYNLLTDWQGVLAKRWVEVLFNTGSDEKEPWFNNNLRIFVLEFLNKYDKMTPEQKEIYKQTVENLIKKR